MKHMQTLYFRLDKQSTEAQKKDLEQLITEYLKVTKEHIEQNNYETQHIIVRNNVAQLIAFMEFYYNVNKE